MQDLSRFFTVFSIFIMGFSQASSYSWTYERDTALSLTYNPYRLFISSSWASTLTLRLTKWRCRARYNLGSDIASDVRGRVW